MSITYDHIPSDILQPLFYAEVNSDRAGVGTTERPSLIIAQMLTAGTATADAVIQVRSDAHANTLFGVGSYAARMVASYFANDSAAILYVIPVADPATAATGTLVIAGTATENGTLHLLLAGQELNITIVDGDTPTDIGDAIETALGINEAAALVAQSEFPLIASNAIGTVTMTARQGGPGGNKIDMRVNYLGAPAQEYPDPVAVAVTPMSGGGAVDSVLTNAIVAMGDTRYSYLAHHFLTSTELDRLEAEFADSTGGRWGPMRKLYGGCWSADVDTYANLSVSVLAAAMNNDAHSSIFGIEASPTPPWEIAAAYCGRAAQSLRSNPALNLNTLELIGVKAPAVADRFEYDDRDVLLRLGITTPMISSDGKVKIQRAVTNHTKTAAGGPSKAFRDVTTPANIDFQLAELEVLLVTKYARHKLVSDDANVDPGQRVVTPNMIFADIVAQYKQWEREAKVEDADTMVSLLVVERNSADENRVDVLYPPDLANNLHALAVQAQFRLQFSQAEVEGAQ